MSDIQEQVNKMSKEELVSAMYKIDIESYDLMVSASKNNKLDPMLRMAMEMAASFAEIGIKTPPKYNEYEIEALKNEYLGRLNDISSITVKLASAASKTTTSKTPKP